MECNICHREFKSQTKLRLHMRSHTGKQPHKCLHCDKRFSQPGNLKVHVSRVHQQLRPYQCNDCDKSFGYQSHYKTHLRTHFLTQVPNTTVRKQLLYPYACEFCPKNIETKRQLALHMHTHTRQRPFECAACQKKFSTRKGIRNHIVKAVCLKPSNAARDKRRKEEIPCSICGKSIARYCIDKHRNTHTRDREYPCRKCNRVFLESSHRTIHERTHSGVKPYKCHVCSKSFSQRGNRTTHMKRRHGQAKATDGVVGGRDTTDEETATTINQLDTVPMDSNNALEIIYTVKDQTKNKVDLAIAGSHSLQEFIEIAGTWIALNQETSIPEETQPQSQDNIEKAFVPQATFNKTLQLEQNQNQEAASQRLDETAALETMPDNSSLDANARLRNIKSDIWHRFYEEIKEKQEVQTIMSSLDPSKGDPTLRLINRLNSIPANGIVKSSSGKTLTWHCWDCSAYFNNRHKLVRHRLSHIPTNEQPHECSICSRKFSQVSNLQYHVLTHASTGLQRPFACDMCGSKFRCKKEIHDHIEKKHNDEKTQTGQNPPQNENEGHLCHFCGKSFRTASLHSQHINKHTHQLLCTFCNKLFADYYSCKRHVLAHHGTPTLHKCECGKCFTQACSLRRHKTVCGNTPSRHFKCDHDKCSKTFPDEAQLKRHVATHLPGSRFPCTKCPLALKTKETLMRHMRRKHET